ncbi:MAG: helix-turn-helix transcriptional regulator [Lachnospiraceae bacterium]
MDEIKDTGSRMYSEDAVLKLMLQGKSRDEICEVMGMPLGTVNNYCTRIYKRTGCKSLVELLVKHNAQNTAAQDE